MEVVSQKLLQDKIPKYCKWISRIVAQRSYGWGQMRPDHYCFSYVIVYYLNIQDHSPTDVAVYQEGASSFQSRKPEKSNLDLIGKETKSSHKFPREPSVVSRKPELFGCYWQANKILIMRIPYCHTAYVALQQATKLMLCQFIIPSCRRIDSAFVSYYPPHPFMDWFTFSARPIRDFN